MGFCSNRSFPRFPTYVILIHQRYRQTDRQIDDMQSQYRALHYCASRDKNFAKTYDDAIEQNALPVSRRVSGLSVGNGTERNQRRVDGIDGAR